MIQDIAHTFASLEAEAYIARYRDADRIGGYCRACDRCGKVWSCPPFEVDPAEKLARYRGVRLVGTTVRLTEAVRHAPTSPDEQFDISYRIMREVRRTLDARLLEAERRRAGSLAFFAGSCQLCHPAPCARTEGRPCLLPDRARSSLEAWGFDVVRTASELLGLEMRWSQDLVLPEYFTYVSALFTPDLPDNEPLW